MLGPLICVGWIIVMILFDVFSWDWINGQQATILKKVLEFRSEGKG